MNLQSKARAYQVGEKHYDTGNQFFENMLDKRMVYTCGYWKEAQNLDEAQEAKLDLVCRKLNLQPGQRILDIGCGWGSFVKFAAEKYGVEAVGITISKEQAAYGKKNTDGLPVEIRLQDYRSVNETFDHVISLGMMEHVGYKNYRIYMEVVDRCLKDDGLFLLHTIGNLLSAKSGDLFADKYIFPNAVAPSPRQLTAAMENLFVIEDWRVFGHDYY
jgi:cyclopropane-fatty-acyl-phospholipid synthase